MNEERMNRLREIRKLSECPKYDGNKSSQEFEDWWYAIGSGITPFPEHDLEAHTHRVAKMAWINGAYQAINRKED